MKPSHYTTPRTLSECVFLYDADPIDAPEKRPFDKQDKVVMWGCFVAAVALMVVLWTS